MNVALDYCLDKVGDVKCGKPAKEALNCMAEYLSLPFLISKVLPKIEKIKNVKNIANAWAWISDALPLFGFGKLDLAAFADHSKKGLAHTNAGVRESCVTAIVTVMRFVPPFQGNYSKYICVG